MTKSRLIEELASRTGITKSQAKKVIDTVIEITTEALKRDEPVVIPGFGKFYTAVRGERTGRNPATGEMIKIPEKKRPVFRSGETLKRAVG